jgi:hypothetical protein
MTVADQGTKSDIWLDQAVEAYRKWELKNLAADRAYKELNHAVMYLAVNFTEEERAELIKRYYERTEVIRQDFEKKREKEGL